MADARIIHKRGSFGERIIALTHLDYRVWVQYVLSADDFGVLRSPVTTIRHDNPALEREPIKKVDAAVKGIIAVGLIRAFTYNRDFLVWQHDWNDWQGIRYPRETMNPLPPETEMVSATMKTLGLFSNRCVPERKDFWRHFGNMHEAISEMAQKLGRKESGNDAAKKESPDPRLLRGSAGGRPGNTNTDTNANAPKELEESARETSVVESEPSWRKASEAPGHRGGLIDGHAQRIHGVHAFCGRVCVPLGLHAEFKGRLGGDRAEDRLKAWYPAVLAEYDGRPIGDEMFTFWRNEFAAWVGTVTVKPTSVSAGRSSQNRQAFATAISTLEGATHGRTSQKGHRPPRALDPPAGDD